MIVYHEVQPSSVEDILRDGLKRTSRGEKGEDELIKRVDKLLDKRRSADYRDQGISRDNNLYAYYASDGEICDITDGSSVPIVEFIANSDQAVLELEIDPGRSYVSDLDRYDALKHAVDAGGSDEEIERLADDYWSAIIPLSSFTPGGIDRPEVLITYDVPPHEVRRVS